MNNVYIQHGIACPRCGDEVYSNSRHDFESCLCGAVFIDGGWDYKRVGYDEGGAGFRSVSRTVDRKALPSYYSNEDDRRKQVMAWRGLDGVPSSS